MSIANSFRLALVSGLLVLAVPALGSDLLIVNVEAIKQTAIKAVLDAHPEVFEDDLVVDAHQNNITLVCMPDRYLDAATTVEHYAHRCNASFRFHLRDSIELQQFVDGSGNCYEHRTASGFSVAVYSDGSTQLSEITGSGGSTTWIECEDMLNASGAQTRQSARNLVTLEVAPRIAEHPPGPGLFHVDVAGIRQAAARAAEAAYPQYSGGGLLPDNSDRPLLVNCHSILEQGGESAVPGMYLCFAHVEFTIEDSVETANFLADDGTCSLASKQLSVLVAVGDDGNVVVDRPNFGCHGTSGDGIACDSGPNTPSESEAFDEWCQPGEKQALVSR